MSVFFFLFLLVTVASCKLNQIQFKGIEDYQVVNASISGAELKVLFTIDNPSAFNILIRKSTLDLYVDDKSIGTLNIDEKVKVKKRAEGVYELPIKASFDKLPVSSLMKPRIKAKINGKIKTRAFIFFKKIKVEETMTFKPDEMF